MRDVAIRDEMIRLGQFLQLAGVVDGGSDAKALLAAGIVTVNDEPEQRRGRQLHPGDVVAVQPGDGFGDEILRVAGPAA